MHISSLRKLSDPKAVIKKIRRLVYIRAARSKYKKGWNPKIYPGVSVNQDITILFTERQIGHLAGLEKQHLPDLVKKDLAYADEYLQKKFVFLNHQFKFQNDDINWFLDPVSGKKWPAIFSFDIVYRGPGRLSDIKLPWELAKMQYIFLLAKAHALTGHQKYIDGILSHIDSWIASNPPFKGIHWISALEIGMRVVSFILIYPFIRGKVKINYLERFIASVYEQALFIDQNLSGSKYANTHLIGEAFALLLCGLFLKSDKSAKWYSRGFEILSDQILLQVHPDGVDKEQSTNYQRFFLDYYYMFIILHRFNGLPYPSHIDKQVEMMTDFLLAVSLPNGNVPAIGDADDARGIWLKSYAHKDYRGLFALGAVLFERPDYKFAAKGGETEVIWLIGETGINIYQSLEPVKPSETVYSFNSGGYYVIRNGFEETNHCLVFDCGPLGSGPAGHGHADALSIQLFKGGMPFITDTGTYSYNLDYDWRNYFRSTRAHSTVVVDGLDQSQIRDRMSWATFARAEMNHQISGEHFTLFGGSHNGYMRLDNPVNVSRFVFYDNDDGWAIFDLFLSNGKHTYDQYFQIDGACTLKPVSDHNNQMVITNSGQKLHITMHGRNNSNIRIFKGQSLPFMAGWISPEYGLLQDCSSIRCRLEAHGNVAMMTFLSFNPYLKVENACNRSDAFSFSYKKGDDITHFFYYNFIYGNSFNIRTLSFDGRVVWGQFSCVNHIKFLEAYDVNRLEVKNTCSIESNLPVQSILITANVVTILTRKISDELKIEVKPHIQVKIREINQ